MQKRILVVDDDPLFIELITDLLRSQQHDVVAARNGRDALEVLANQIVDVIVSDYEMPTMNGIALHARVALDERLNRIPFIFITGSGDAAIFTYVRAHPSTSLIQKMNMVEELLPAIARMTVQK